MTGLNDLGHTVEAFRNSHDPHNGLNLQWFTSMEVSVRRQSLRLHRVRADAPTEPQMEVRSHLLDPQDTAMAATPGRIVPPTVGEPKHRSREDARILQLEVHKPFLRERDGRPAKPLDWIRGHLDEVLEAAPRRI